MASTSLRKEERIGLVVAVLLHVAILGALLVRLPHHNVVKPPERIEVTISDDAGLTSTSPNPAPAAADKAPEQGEPAPPAAAPVPEIAPAPSPLPQQPAPRVIETPRPERPVTRTIEKPRPTPEPTRKPVQKPVAQKVPPKPAPQPRSSAIDDIVKKPTPARKPASKSASSSAAKPSTRPGTSSASSSAGKSTTPPRKVGASSFDDAFKDGVPGAKAPTNAGKPAAAIGPQVRSALSAAITRQLKPHWQAPQGPDAEELVTYLAFSLNPDGSLAGTPTVVRQTGITDTNRAQAPRHAEQAIRAVRLAAPFDLPPEYYDAWKRVSSFQFDKRLSQ